jgi:hypothetical protein
MTGNSGEFIIHCAMMNLFLNLGKMPVSISSSKNGWN